MASCGGSANGSVGILLPGVVVLAGRGSVGMMSPGVAVRIAVVLGVMVLGVVLFAGVAILAGNVSLLSLGVAVLAAVRLPSRRYCCNVIVGPEVTALSLSASSDFSELFECSGLVASSLLTVEERRY